MQNILNNLSDPAWWFTAFIPTLAVLLAPKVWRFLVGLCGRFSRKVRAKSLRRVREMRGDDILIAKEMFSAQASFVVFMLTVVVGLILLVLSPFTIQPSTSRIFMILLAIPVLVSEVFWLIKDMRVHDLLKYRRRLRRKGCACIASDIDLHSMAAPMVRGCPRD